MNEYWITPSKRQESLWITNINNYKGTQRGCIVYLSTKYIEAIVLFIRFANPIYVDGEYPPIMQFQVHRKSEEMNLTETRLPKFTEDEKKLIIGNLNNLYNLTCLIKLHQISAWKGNINHSWASLNIVKLIGHCWNQTGSVSF